MGSGTSGPYIGSFVSLLQSPAWNLPGFYSLELDYQERFENFSDFGGTERPKFSVRWQPIDSGLTIRATYSEAYHAPTLSDLFRGVEVETAQGTMMPGGLVQGRGLLCRALKRQSGSAAGNGL